MQRCEKVGAYSNYTAVSRNYDSAGFLISRERNFDKPPRVRSIFYGIKITILIAILYTIIHSTVETETQMYDRICIIIFINSSGEEGFYPDLTRHAEERLALVKPTSIILRKSEPVIKRSMLGASECKEIDKDINNWTSEMQSREKDLEEGKSTLFVDRSCSSTGCPTI